MTVTEKIENKEFEIVHLKTKLARTDYKAIKFAEDQLSESEYAPVREERKALRAQIRALETEIAVLKG